jgi:hypothetical protein
MNIKDLQSVKVMVSAVAGIAYRVIALLCRKRSIWGFPLRCIALHVI